jgi:hypothetical protein
MAPAFSENTAAPLTRATVHQVLTNPKYIGANISNRGSFKLKHLSLVRGDRAVGSLNFMAPE